MIYPRYAKHYEFCIPTTGSKVPNGHEWFHDGYRLRVERNGDRVRLITRGGYDWSKRYPWIADSALKNRHKHFVIDGEAVVRLADGLLISTLCILDTTVQPKNVLFPTDARFSKAPALCSRKTV